MCGIKFRPNWRRWRLKTVYHDPLNVLALRQNAHLERRPISSVPPFSPSVAMHTVFRRPEAVKVEAGGWKEFFGVFGMFALVKRIEKVKFVEKFDVVEVFF